MYVDEGAGPKRATAMEFEVRSIEALLAAAIVLGTIGLGACGSEGNGGNTTTATGSATASATTGATPTVTTATSPAASPTAAPTQDVPRTARTFIYTTNAQDTIDTIAPAFSGQPGASTTSFSDEIRSLNPTVNWPIPSVGSLVLVPLMQSDGLSIVPFASMKLALGNTDSVGGLTVLHPSTQTMDGFRGQVALRAVKLARPADAGGAGYVMEYWLTDRRFLKGGEIDPEALVTTPAFVIAGGSLAHTLTGDVFEFETGGVSYTVKALAGAEEITPQQIAESLSVAAP